MTAFLPLLLRLLPYLLGAAIVIGGWLWVDRVCWSSACVTKTHQLRELEAQIEQARERATALALKWSEAINKVEVRYVERDKKAAATVAGFRERIERNEGAYRGSGLRLPPAAVELLGDVARFANDSAHAGVDQVTADPVPTTAGDTTLAEWLTFAADAGAAYRDAADKHLACVAAYEAIQTGDR